MKTTIPPKWFAALSLISLTLFLNSGCKPRPTAAHASTRAAGTNSASSWENFPAVKKMRLASLPCQLQPKSTINVYSPLIGVLQVRVTQPQTNLSQGVVWAEFEPDIFQAEEEALEEAHAKILEREKLQFEIEVPRQKLQLERQIDESSRQVALLNLLSTNPDVAQLNFNLDGRGSVLRPEALGKAQTELGLLTQTLGYLQATNLAILGVDLPGMKSDWQRRKLEFDRRRSQARLKMPFDGQLTVGIPLTEGVSEYPVNSGQEVGVARDLSAIRARVAIGNPAWTALPPEQLEVVIHMSNGRDLSAPFAFQKIEKVQTREEAVYYFQFPAERSAEAARLIGSDVSADVWVKLPEPARVVSKLALLLQDPSNFQGRNWAQGVSSAWPGARLVVEGQTELAIAGGSKLAKK